MSQETNSNPSSSKEKEPINADEASDGDGEQSNEGHHEPEEEDEQQPPPPPRPSALKRAIWLLVICFVVWRIVYKNTWFGKKEPKIIHAKRYSKEFKYRPAASPIVTQTLNDGRIRIHGAEPSTSSQPKVTPPAVKKTKKRSSKKRAKHRAKQGHRK